MSFKPYTEKIKKEKIGIWVGKKGRIRGPDPDPSSRKRIRIRINMILIRNTDLLVAEGTFFMKSPLSFWYAYKKVNNIRLFDKSVH